VHSLEKVTGAQRLSFEQKITYRIELEQHFLEPQLVDLMDGDEQELVVSGRIRKELLERQQVGDLQVAAVGQLAILLTEARRSALLGQRQRLGCT
jgi:hypothetical protein